MTEDIKVSSISTKLFVLLRIPAAIWPADVVYRVAFENHQSWMMYDTYMNNSTWILFFISPSIVSSTIRFNDDCLIEPMFCEKDHRLVRVEVNLNPASQKVTCAAQEILINDWCTGSNHHGGGGMAFMPSGDMVLAVGDLSKVYKAIGIQLLYHT